MKMMLRLLAPCADNGYRPRSRCALQRTRHAGHRPGYRQRRQSCALQSQRLAKLWLQAGLGIQAGTATGQLARGTAQFDAALAHLKPCATQLTT